MAQCDYQTELKLKKRIIQKGTGLIVDSVPINCGKCYNCKRNKINQWSFRLMKELENSFSAYFITLTYDTLNVPITAKGLMTLQKTSPKNERGEKVRNKDNDRSLQGFFKRLRHHEQSIGELPIKYYAVGEYGTIRKRPHYHAIVFNIRDKKSIERAWTYGIIHIDECNNNTIDYTLKYIMKATNNLGAYKGDRLNEFSIMSKNLGKNYLTEEVKKHFRDNLNQNYLINKKGFKIPMIKYYRDIILTDEQKRKQIPIIKYEMEKAIKKAEKGFNDPQKFKNMAKGVRQRKLMKGEERRVD